MNFFLKYNLCLCSVLASFFLLPASANEVTPLDKVVVIVGEGVVTESELNKEVFLASNNIKNSGASMPDITYLRGQVLERMVIRRALGDFADNTGIRVSDNEIREALQRLAQQQNLSVSDYLQAFEDNGLSISQLRESLVIETKILKLRRREIEANLLVNESEIESYLKRVKEGVNGLDEFLIAHILIAIPENATAQSSQVSQEKLQKAISRLDDGLDFRQVAAETSDASDALEGGVMGWKDATSLPDLFLDALESLRIGERSDILRSPNGFHILYLMDKRGRDAQIIVQETSARHILFKVNPAVPPDEALQRATEARNRILIGGESFEVLAKVLSDDTSGTKGGNLGWLLPGETVPEFERALDELELGELSQPVRSQFGYHLIEVLDRRDSDVSEERQRSVARQAILQQKLEFRFEEWIREVRDTTFIKYIN